MTTPCPRLARRAAAVPGAGQDAVLDVVRQAEVDDADCRRWPRSKRHDDQALVVVDFAEDPGSNRANPEDTSRLLVETLTSMGQLGTKAASTEAAQPGCTHGLSPASAALGWALFLLVILHLVSSFDPIFDPVSRYAFTDAGRGMLEVSLLSFAVGVVSVRGALLASGLPVSRTATILIITTATVWWPPRCSRRRTPRRSNPVSGLIHEYASLLAFLSLPGVAVSMLDQIRDIEELQRVRRMLTRLVWVSLASLALFGLGYLSDKVTFGFTPWRCWCHCRSDCCNAWCSCWTS